MFAYCGNNPVNGSDPCGTYVHRLDSCYFLEQYTSAHSSKRAYPNETLSATVSVGITASFCITGWSYFSQLSIATDTDGDSELQFCGGVALTSGEVGGSLMANMTITNAPDVKNLHGMGYQMGGTFAGASLDYVVIPDQERGTAYSGFSFSGGYSTSDIHVSMGNTFPIVTLDFSLLEFFDAVYKSYWGIYQ